MGKDLIVKIRGILGLRKDIGDIQEIICLKRIPRWIPSTFSGMDKIEIEADARHVNLILQHLCLKKDSKGVIAPSTRVNIGTGELLNAEQHSHFRFFSMRAAFLAEDRADLKFPTKELARCMSAPTTVAWDQLRKLGRYLVQAPRVVQIFRRQKRPSVMTIYSDSDHAGCLRTRRSTSASVVMLGTHCLKVSSTTQVPIALSSGESEWYALVKSATIQSVSACDLQLGTSGKSTI